MPETVLVNGNAYSLLKLLGKGKGGYSYLAQMADCQQVVVKQIHHKPCVYYQFGKPCIPLRRTQPCPKPPSARCRPCAACCTRRTPTLTIFPPISFCRAIRCTILTMSATTTWTNGTLKTGAANTGQKRRNFCSMPPNTRNVCPLPRGLEKGIICSGSAFSDIL